MKNSYNLKKFNEVFQGIVSFTQKEGLDLNQCAISVDDCGNGKINITCYDNISQRMFGCGMDESCILPFNWKKMTDTGTN